MESDRRVKVLIPCAGNGVRFGSDEDRPKHLIQVEYNGVQRAMVQHVIRGLPDHRSVTLGVRPGVVAATCIVHARIVTVTKSEGQADTLAQMLDCELNDGQDWPCLVLNCDALIQPNVLRRLIRAVTEGVEYTAACAVTWTSDPGMSYVNSIPHPTRFAEKERISGYGMVGAWAFRSMNELRLAIWAAVEAPERHNGEIYLSHALNYLPRRRSGLWSLAESVHKSDVVDWNTPEALERSGARIMW